MRIEARAPTRIDLAGGTLDIWPLYLFHPGAVTVNCAVTRHASCAIETRPGRAIELVSRDTGRRERFSSFDALARSERCRLPLLAHLVRHFRPQDGLRVETNSEAPAGAGLGGSSAMAVALCAALDRLTGARLGRIGWIHASRDVEAVVIGAPAGTQDHYPAAFGGVAALHLETGGERREPLAADPAALERRLVLCYTGKPRQSAINNWRVFVAHMNGDRRVRRNLAAIADIARAMREAVAGENWDEAGRLMREEWNFRRRNLPTISTPTIDRIIETARRQGALAGKVCGAGGGGCVALLIDPDARERVERAAQEAGGTLLPCKIDRRGVRVHASHNSKA
jgi:D-glycero-alpha-D-manno-heptose-7-phosphate kinase